MLDSKAFTLIDLKHHLEENQKVPNIILQLHTLGYANGGRPARPLRPPVMRLRPAAGSEVDLRREAAALRLMLL